jgi:hypothetical protein
LLLLGGIRYALASDVAGDMVGDSIQLAGGVALIFLGASLLKMMTGGRR